MQIDGALRNLPGREIFLCTALMFLGVFLRIYSMNYLDAADNYNDVAYKNLYENGISFYRYTRISTFLSIRLLKTFGFSIPVLKIPSIIYSAITMIGIYLSGRLVNRPTAAIALFLFAVSPWSIVLSKVTRDYQFDCMIAATLLPVVLYTIRKMDTEAISRSVLMLLAISVGIVFLSILNHRHQTLIVLLYTAAGCAATGCYWIAERKWKFAYKIIILAILGPVLILLLYSSHYKNFPKGFVFNRYYLDLFFKAYLTSPWQWFHGNSFMFGTKLLGIFFLLPAAAMIGPLRKQWRELILLYVIFFGSVSFYCFKFVSHLHYQPSRYIYFLFPAYVTIFAAAFYSLWSLLSRWKMVRVIALICVIPLFFNVRALAYAVNPGLGCRTEGVGSLPIDNIGIGRFDLNEVVVFLQKELGWTPSDTYVFGGRYCEYILLLDYPMDPDRFLLRNLRGDLYPYDVGKNMYVESSYFGYHELKMAALRNNIGYFVTMDKHIKNINGSIVQFLGKNDFNLYGRHFQFIKEIHETKIYRWGKG